ncbi:MAG: apolipoprotein N-acyltransferase [Myxococcota bacterium]|jgi:apolipoprotein N-acyltransferase
MQLPGFSSMTLRPAPGTLVSAALVAASLPPWDFGFLIWIALAPWFFELRASRSHGEAAAQGLWLGVGVTLLSAYWVAFALHEFLAVSWPVAIVGLLLFSATCSQSQFLFFAPLFRVVTNRLHPGAHPLFGLAMCAAMALVYVGLDWLSPRVFDVGLGYALHGSPHLLQLADIGGVAALTCFIVLTNVFAWRGYELWQQTRRLGGELVSIPIVVVALFASAYAYGVIRIADVDEWLKEAGRNVAVGIVQGNVENETRLAWAAGDDLAAETQLSTYMRLTEKYIEQSPRPEMVIWPEASFPGVFQKPGSKLQHARANRFDRQVLRLNVPIVFGAYDVTEGAGNPEIMNSLFAITPNYTKPGHQGFVQRYHKHHLLAFAETLPGAAKIDWVQRLLPSLGFFGRGPGAATWRVVTPNMGSIMMNPIICSESLSPQHVIDGVAMESDVIVNVGSDGWFGTYGEPEFHLAIAKFRSVETRRPQIRAANTGISALILPDGRVAARSALSKQENLEFVVPIGEAQNTLMLKWGDWFGPFAFVAGGALLLLLVRLGPKQRQ